jgi:hypothetical protein
MLNLFRTSLEGKVIDKAAAAVGAISSIDVSSTVWHFAGAFGAIPCGVEVRCGTISTQGWR